MLGTGYLAHDISPWSDVFLCQPQFCGFCFGKKSRFNVTNSKTFRDGIVCTRLVLRETGWTPAPTPSHVEQL